MGSKKKFFFAVFMNVPLRSEYDNTRIVIVGVVDL